jgi:catechol 2,3-dioxygenase-like lactoylglutathione lyase family enzyme
MTKEPGSKAPFVAIDHFQLAMPAGAENRAREFFCNLLGMTEIAKPPALAKRGGCWFSSGKIQIHLGVEKDFRPATKAHPALVCHAYHELLELLRIAGVAVQEDSEIPEVVRCYISDPFGNRIELIAQ